MRINKELVKSKTITFISIVIFVVIFKSIFGSENTLIGVTTVTATLMFLERDLTLNPFKNTLKFIGLNLFIGLGAMLAGSNIYVGILTNFVVMFTISYIFCYNLRNPLYLAFSLQYLFILVNPVSGMEIWIRLLALITGAIIIMLAQIIVNKNRLSKNGNAILISVCDLIINILENKDDNMDDHMDSDMNNNMDDLQRHKTINISIDSFRSMIYDKREYNYYLTEEGRLKLSISVALENINSMLSIDTILHIDQDILDTIHALMREVKLVLNNPDEKNDIAANRINELLKICEDKEISDLLNLQLLDSILLLADTLESLKKLDIKHFNFVDKQHRVTNMFSDNTFKSLFVDKKSLKFCYAMRLSITIAIGTFIMNYFNLTEGRWILFTILSLTNPLYEISKSKTKDRVFSTLMGSIIIVILFSIFKDSTIRMVIVMINGYLQGYVKKYKYNMIFVTISAIGSAALVDNVQTLTIDRILFVILGAILALLANKFLFPYSVLDSINHLKKMYHSTIVSMLTEIQHLVKGEKRPNHMKNLLVLTSLIDAKARTNTTITSSPSYDKVITERRNLVANIYELYILILKRNLNTHTQMEILSELSSLIEYCDESIDNKIKHLEYNIKISKDINTKIILSSITVILKELCHLSEL